MNPQAAMQERICIVTPREQDANELKRVLVQADLKVVHCDDLSQCALWVEQGIGVMVIAEEALETKHIHCVLEALGKQPPWSDLPVLMLTDRANAFEDSRILDLLKGSVTLLERPLPEVTLLGTVQMALRARRRQYQVRELLAAQRETEGRFRAFMDKTPLVAWAKDAHGRHIYLNQTYQARFGVRLEDWLGKSDFDLWPAEVARNFDATDRRVLSRGETVKDLQEIADPDGRRCSWLVFKFPFYDAGGRKYIGGIGIDVTESKRAEEALRESEQRLRLAVETAALGLYERDLVSNIATFNQHCLAILGLPEGCTDPGVARKSLYPGDRQRILELVDRAFDPQLREICGAEFRVVRPDGGVRWVSGRGRVIFDAASTPPRPLKFLGVLHDITERKTAEESLERQNRRLTLLNEAAAYLLSAGDPREIMSSFYERIAEYFQADTYVAFKLGEHGDCLELESCCGLSEQARQTISRLDLGEGVCGVVAQRRSPIVAGHIQESQNPMVQVLKDVGIRVWACSPLLLAGNLLGTLAFGSRVRDTFEPEDVEFFQTLASYVAMGKERVRLTNELRRYAQELEQAVAERTADLRDMVSELEHMSYSIVHDMRAPLRAMMSYSQLLLVRDKERLSDSGKNFLERIMSAATRMDLLITDTLSYSKAVRSKLPLGPVDPAQLLRGIIDSYPEFQSPRTDITLEGEFPLVRGNAAGLTQCFSNFLNNALKFVEPGQAPRVRIWSELRSEPAEELHGAPGGSGRSGASANRQYLRIWFEDNGIGIPKDAENQIFKMFQRFHGDQFEGTGIGLALVRKVAERMGGRVGVEPGPTNGSRFWIQLRLAEVEES